MVLVIEKKFKKFWGKYHRLYFIKKFLFGVFWGYIKSISPGKDNKNDNKML